MPNLSRIKNQYSKISWYKQGGAANPLYLSHPLDKCYHFTILGKTAPINYQKFITSITDNIGRFYFPKNNLTKVAQYYFKRQQQDKGFIYRLKKNWEIKYIKKF